MGRGEERGGRGRGRMHLRVSTIKSFGTRIELILLLEDMHFTLFFLCNRNFADTTSPKGIPNAWKDNESNVMYK